MVADELARRWELSRARERYRGWIAEGRVPATVAAGQSATLKWSSTDAAECAASGAWGPGAEPLSGSVKVTPAVAGSYTFTLACNGAGTASKSVVLTVQ